MPFYVAAGIALVGTAASIAGQAQSTHAQSAASAYQAQVAANNAKIATYQSNYTREAGAAEEQASELKSAQLTGSQVAAQAANGIDVSSGSALAVRESSAITGKYDAMTIRQNADNQALGYQTEGLNYSSQSGVDRSAAVNAAAAGDPEAISSALSGASSLSSKWYALQQQGGLSPSGASAQQYDMDQMFPGVGS